ncbi:unnamed protein product [Staurois parvus]|uniref:Elongation of very long chain fatty acids protein n=1 Tax=Staurois parvus TaxID=386267 RepID=A0ABN9H926_9NEOB|nr:unnamed protein product [Staurois parvus]
MKIVRVLWWYYFSKLIEFMDTFFFILRKNNHQITVLHVYHHASMLNIWWFVMNWVPCGHSYFWCYAQQLYSCSHVFLLWTVRYSSHAPISVVEEVHHSVPVDSICPDNDPDQLCDDLALCFPNGLAVFPELLHDLSDHPLHQFLH